MSPKGQATGWISEWPWTKRLPYAVRIVARVDGPVPWVTQVVALRLNLSGGRPNDQHQRGVALLLVLWVLALLSLLLGGLAGWVQLETRQAAWHRQHTQAVLAAEAGVALAMQAVADPLQRKQWMPTGVKSRWRSTTPNCT